jgi:hypothetical protein
VVTKHQLNLIKSYGIKNFYLALDEDAADEINALAKTIEGKTFIITVPNSCKERCKKENKKADFGECTYQECIEAFNNARVLDNSFMVTYLKY